MSEELETAPVENADANAETPSNEAENSPEVEGGHQDDETGGNPVDLEEEKPESDPNQKKFAKMSWELRQAKRRNAELARLVEQQNTADTPKETPKPPNIEDYQSLDEYLDARDKYRDSQRESTKQRAETPMQDVESSSVSSEAYNDLYMTGIEKYPEFADVVSSDEIRVTADMAAALFDIDDVNVQVDVAWFLGNNPKEATRISKLSPVGQAKAIARLEDKLTAKPAPTKRASDAPKPMKPVGGSKTPNNEIGETEDFETFMRKRNKQLGRT